MDFLDRSPLIREAIDFAAGCHEGQTRDSGDAPFVTHPVEVARLLHAAGYPDEVVAAGVLHDVIENTPANRADLERRFGPEVARLVAAVSDDESIEDYGERKAALRDQVARAGDCAAAVFAADKISKVRELRARTGGGRFERRDEQRVEHYSASLEMLDEQLPGRSLVDKLRAELDGLHALG